MPWSSASTASLPPWGAPMKALSRSLLSQEFGGAL